MECVEEDTRNYFENTLDKLPFSIENICSQTSGENSEIDEKTKFKTLLKSYVK